MMVGFMKAVVTKFVNDTFFLILYKIKKRVNHGVPMMMLVGFIRAMV